MFAQKSSDDFIKQITNIEEIGGMKGHCAIVVNQYESSTYLTYHDIDTNNKIKDGKFIDIAQAVKALATLNDEPIESECNWIDTDILYSSDNQLIWYVPAQKRTLWFVASENKFSLKVHTPSFVFALNRNARKLRVFSCKSKSRPTPESKLYNAPLMNVSLDGSLCLGSATLPDNVQSDSKQIRNACESALFDTNFSHVNNSKTFKSKKEVTTTGHVAFWKKFEKENREPKASELVLSTVSFKTLTQGA
ncbi:PRTRC system protein B [Pseudoalteromonas sp. APC 3358]|uniref:PRTRC system protein B n=1 Tax=unclassified Pseudoalteromonas TaxID=194690 RepID=UPI000422E46E|nr:MULTISPECIES: PRTRC system protein B [unclassified Pseudoalteromonas]MDN3384468.1 PRTRC system protein B [Pseudoalteromonas sp. APC 3358]